MIAQVWGFGKRIVKFWLVVCFSSAAPVAGQSESLAAHCGAAASFVLIRYRSILSNLSRLNIMSYVNPSAHLGQIHQPAAWNQFVIHNRGHLLQSFEWGELKSRFGWRAERWAWSEGDVLRAGAQVLYRRLLPGLQLAYIPRGPVVADADFLQALRQSLRARGVFLLKVEPDWRREDSREAVLSAASLRHTAETIQPSATIRIDLTRDLDAILATMKPKWRYNIRLAEKKGVVVRIGTVADLPAFYDLTRITAERDQFGIHALDYYRAAFELLHACNAARLFMAEYEGQNLATIFVTAFGHEAIYLYGASGNAHRNVMPNHALHWAAIQWAKSCGCEWYDLWGIPDETRISSRASSGRDIRVSHKVDAQDTRLPDSLYQFKQGFGGEVVHYTGAWDFVYAPASYAIYRAARRIRRGGLG